MSPNGLFRVSMSHGVSWISHHLVSHVDRHVELLRQLDQLVEHLTQYLLPLRQLPPTSKVAPKAGHNRVHDHQSCRTVYHKGCCDVKQLIDVLHCVTSGVFYIVEGGFRVEAEPFSNLHDSFRAAEWFKNYKVPSVSMQITLPLPPPLSFGSCEVTQRVWASWVLPVLNSPKASVIAIDSIPPPRHQSSTGDPVVILTMFFLFSTSSLPVIKLAFSIFLAISCTLSILPSLKPLMLQSSFLVAMMTLETVQYPAALSLVISAALMPPSCSLSISEKAMYSSSTSSTSSSLSRDFCIYVMLQRGANQSHLYLRLLKYNRYVGGWDYNPDQHSSRVQLQMPPKPPAKKEAVLRPDNSGLAKHDVDFKWTFSVTSSSPSINYILLFNWFGLTSDKMDRIDTPTIDSWPKQKEQYTYQKEFPPIRVDDDFCKRLCGDGFAVYVVDPEDNSVKEQVMMDLSGLLMARGDTTHCLSYANDKLKVMEIEGITITVEANKELLPPVYRHYLNPFEVEVIGAKSVPDESSKNYLPSYVKYQFFDSTTIITPSVIGKNKLVWTHKHVFLVGLMDAGELKEKIRGRFLRFQLHDRDEVKNVEVKENLELTDVRRLIEEEEERQRPKEEDPKKKKEQKKELKKEVKKDTKKKQFKGEIVLPPKKETISSNFGISAFYLIDFLKPNVSHLKLKAPVVPKKVFEDYESKKIDLNTTARTEMQKVMSCNTYFDNDTTLAVGFTLSHPLGTFVKPPPLLQPTPAKQDKKGTKLSPTKREELPGNGGIPSNEGLPNNGGVSDPIPPNQSVFSRIIYLFPYKSPEHVKSLQDTFYSVNLRAMKLPHQNLKQLTNMVLKANQKSDKELDIVTGVQLIDNDFRMFIFEGLREGAMRTFEEVVKRDGPNTRTLKILKNRDLTFINRLYSDFSLEIKRIRLRPSLDGLLVDPSIYIRSKVPQEICDTLNSLNNIKKVAENLHMVTTMNLWPTAGGLLQVENKFSSPLSEEDVLGVPKDPRVATVKQVEPERPAEALITEESRLSTKLPRVSEDRKMKTESTRKVHAKSYQKTDFLRFDSYNKQMKRAVVPDNEPVFMYSGQKNNWYEKKMAEFREKVQNDKSHTYTFAKNHLSLSISPYTADGAKKMEAESSHTLQYGAQKFDTILIKTKEERSKLNKRPDEETISNLQKYPYHEGKVLERTLLKTTRGAPLNSENKQEFLQFIGNIDVFSKPEVLKVDLVTPLERERQLREAKKKEEEDEASKLLGDRAFHLKKAYFGDKTSQADRFHDIREGSPTKKGLLLPDKLLENSKVAMTKIIQSQPVSIFLKEPFNDKKDLLSRQDQPELDVASKQFHNYQNPEFLTKTGVYRPLKKSNFD